MLFSQIGNHSILQKMTNCVTKEIMCNSCKQDIKNGSKKNLFGCRKQEAGVRQT